MPTICFSQRLLTSAEAKCTLLEAKVVVVMTTDMLGV